jgi:hypothetical protein
MEIQNFVMPAWMTASRFVGMYPETSMSVWIPTLHSGMTESRVVLKQTETFRSA